ncbi:hypothetical protein WEN_02825 [Mycoplasma wenyonii str. Massachusetts]|uniref:Uncharacterized protein n=1 Tax=Mycoplasma wenyonii (strain Massachusetts) TaxID=1197325 RepID=I6Z6X3_MYCWM|nr:DUF1218 domain-containing protein [Mycoplasma wenyonii]AFN65348.1 hypothetical protein WEN_02825 [Mycoplasma wenyonii str. Massachusetts]
MTKQNFLCCCKNRWTKYGPCKRIVVTVLLFISLVFLSALSLVVLPAITTFYFVSGTIRNILEIQTSCRGGTVSPTIEKEVVGEIADSDEDFVKFPSKDPRYVRRMKNQK